MNMFKLYSFYMEEAGDGTEGTASGDTNSTSQTPAPTGGAWDGADEETAAYIKNKGWASGVDAVRSYQHAERALKTDPSRILIRPREDDVEGQKAFWQSLGAGKSADEYQLKAAEGIKVDENFQKWAQGTFAELGIPKATAQKLFDMNNAYQAERQAQFEQEYTNQVKMDQEELKGLWRDGHDRMVALGQNAAKKLGFDEETLNAIEVHRGYKNTMMFMAELGKKMSEDSFVTGDTDGIRGGLTPAEAKVQLDALKLDETFSKALLDPTHPGHAGAVEKRRSLIRIANPEPSNG